MTDGEETGARAVIGIGQDPRASTETKAESNAHLGTGVGLIGQQSIVLLITNEVFSVRSQPQTSQMERGLDEQIFLMTQGFDRRGEEEEQHGTDEDQHDGL